MSKELYTCTDFEGVSPTNTAAVVVAKDYKHARRLLAAELKRQGLKHTGFTLERVSLLQDRVMILADGDY